MLVGEYMGWNFAVGKGGPVAALTACWLAGILYTCVAMIDSEITSTVAAAGGQYAQAKHIIGPLAAFNVGLYLVMAYTMLEVSNAIVTEKAEAVERTGADLLLSGDLGCLMNMAGKLHRRGAKTRCFHTIEVVAGRAGGPAIGEEG